MCSWQVLYNLCSSWDGTWEEVGKLWDTLYGAICPCLSRWIDVLDSLLGRTDLILSIWDIPDCWVDCPPKISSRLDYHLCRLWEWSLAAETLVSVTHWDSPGIHQILTYFLECFRSLELVLWYICNTYACLMPGELYNGSRYQCLGKEHLMKVT